MNQSVLPAVLLLLAGLSQGGATTNLYVNSSPLTLGMVAPQIDARAWVNRALFQVSSFNSFGAVPFESQITLFFTNVSAPAGTMLGDPGFRFQQNTNGQRLWMDTWENHGTVLTDHDSFFGSSGVFFFSDSRASILQVEATNILSPGAVLGSGAHGLIRLEGKRIDLTRSALRTGSSGAGTTFFSGAFLNSSNYVNDFGITDLYWASGTNNSTRAGGARMVLDGSASEPNFNPPTPVAPTHDVIYPSFAGRFFTNQVSLPGFASFGTNFLGANSFSSGWGVAVNTNRTGQSNYLVQVVFYPTNSVDPDAGVDVRFSGGLVTVAFHSSEFDIANQSFSSNAVYLVDGLASFTNVFLSRNQGANTRRPSTYSVSRTEPFTYRSGRAANSTFQSDLLYKPTYQDVSVTNRYAAYAAQVELSSASSSGSIPYQATNLPGRIEIFGDQVNLDAARIRAESALAIRAGNLVSNRLAQIDAPLVSLDLRSTQPTFVLSNVVPATVKRFSGTLRAWSGLWSNTDNSAGTNQAPANVTFHVLIVDSQLDSVQGVAVNEFAARATNLVLNDSLNVFHSFVVEGSSFQLSAPLTLPFGSSIGNSNFVNIRNFTNDGILAVTGVENFGNDRALAYSNWVNHGTNSAAGIEIRTRNFENSGALVVDGGVFYLDALTATLNGVPQVESTVLFTNITFDFTGLVTNVFSFTNVLTAAPKIESSGDVEIRTRDLASSNSIVSAGRLLLNVTNRLSDGGSNGISRWSVNGGFTTLRKPTTSDLFGTYLRSSAAPFRQVDHFWSGTDVGVSPAGFTNNLALGKLILDAGTNSQMRFFGQGANNALYVDYLELHNFATNFNQLLAIAQNFTIYFANANVPATKLDGAAAGRIRWVPEYAGPLSSTNLTYYFTNGPTITTNIYTFNVARVTSKDLDSDGDGIVNAEDNTPVYVAANAFLAVSLGTGPRPAVRIDWNALAYSSNQVEFREASTSAGPWRLLTNFLHGPYTSPARAYDPLTNNGAVRVYRLKVDPGPFFE